MTVMPLPPPIIDGSVLDELNEQVKIARRDSLLAKKVVMIAMIKRTGCYGKCPEYEAKIFSNDSVFYNGIRHVVREGRFESILDSAWMNTILRKAAEINYLELNNTYPISGKFIESLPSTTTFLSLNGVDKMIENNFDAPQALLTFEQFFEEQLEKLRWSKWRH